MIQNEWVCHQNYLTYHRKNGTQSYCLLPVILALTQCMQPEMWIDGICAHGDKGQVHFEELCHKNRIQVMCGYS